MALSTRVTADHPGRDVDLPPGLYVFDVSSARLFRWNGVFRIEAMDGDTPVEPTVASADPSRLVLTTGAPDAAIEATWDGPDTIRFRGRGVGLRLVQAVIDPLDSAIAFPRGADEWRLQMGEDAHYAVSLISGSIAVEAPRVRTGDARHQADVKVVDVRPDAGGDWEMALTQYVSGFRSEPWTRSFDACVLSTGTACAGWIEPLPEVPDELAEARRLAGYVAWGSVVAPRGNLQRPGMLMSKNWMYAIWSWDNCINAIGLATAHPDLAWDQFMIPFDRQHPQGAPPDIVGDGCCMYGFVKPPVHGWTLRTLESLGVVSDDRLTEIRPRLEAWTDWWTTYRDNDGLCEYFHGNDSGWDNATAFDMGFPAVSPDLTSFLIVQMDTLADIADRNGDPIASQRWRRRANEMLTTMLERLWDGDRFVARRSDDGQAYTTSASLIPFMPLILGARLPVHVRNLLVGRIEHGGSLTDWGVATESPLSPLYERDGYWRGPIWPPTTLLLVDGLDACGARELGDLVARRYLAMCARSGFAENFDAETGQPLRDTAYTWAATTFMALSQRLRG